MGIEIDLFVQRVEIDMFLRSGRQSFGFHTWIEVDLVLVQESRLTFFARAENDSFLLW